MRTYFREYFLNNFNEYIKLLIILVIAVVVAILAINNTNDSDLLKVKEYIDSRIEIVKNGERVDRKGLLLSSLKRNFKEYIIITFLAASVIGLPVAYIIIVKKAFSIGYTISAVFATQSTKTSIIFICNSILFHNIIYMISLAIVLIAGINFVKSLIRKDKFSIKFEILRYCVFVLIGILIVIISSLFETFISTSLLYILKKYI